MARKFLPRGDEALHATGLPYSMRGYAHKTDEFDVVVVLVETAKRTCWSRSRCRAAISSAVAGTPLKEQWQLMRSQVKNVTGVDVGAHPHTGD